MVPHMTNCIIQVERTFLRIVRVELSNQERPRAAKYLKTAAKELWETLTPLIGRETWIRLAEGYPAERMAVAVPAANT